MGREVGIGMEIDEDREGDEESDGDGERGIEVGREGSVERR